MSDLPTTPFTRVIQNAGSESYSWFDFNGYKFADVVRDPVLDLSTGRSGVAFQDVSPMMKFLVKGKDAAQFMDYVSTRRLSSLKPGRVAYFLMVNEDGFIRDDGTAYRLAEDEYLVQSVSNLTGWYEDHRNGLDVQISEVQGRWAELSVYGIGSAAYLKAAGIEGLETLKPFQFQWTKLGGTEMMVSRTGFSGGLGYELMIPWDQAEAALEDILARAGSEAVTFTGNHTGITLRLEIGFLIPGWDFPVPGTEGADPDDFRTPFDMAWDWLVQLDNRGDFLGKAALTRIKEQGSRFRFLAALTETTVTAEDIPGMVVRDASGKEVGKALIGGYSAAVGKSVVFCNIVSSGPDAGAEVTLGDRADRATLATFPLIEIPERSLTPPPGV